MPEIARFRFCSRGSVRPGDHTDRVAWLAYWVQNPEQAVEADEKGLAGWSNHPQLEVVDNSTPFDQKVGASPYLLTSALTSAA